MAILKSKIQIELNIVCPGCYEFVNVAKGIPLGDMELIAGETHKNITVICPECGNNFKIDIEG